MINISKPIVGKEEIEAVSQVLLSGYIVQGPKVQQLEDEFTGLTGAKFALATNSGTSALHTALFALDLKPTDEVITTPFTFIATANAILMAGAKPVFVDIDEKTFNIDPLKIESAITKNTKAILTVDLYGQPANYTLIKKLARKYKLLLIADAAQSIGGTYKNQRVGNIADVTCFSFYATKNIMSGEGGMITTNNKRFYKRAKLFRSHGQDEKNKYNYHFLGFNYRMTDINAAIALVQLKRLTDLTSKRRIIAKSYDLELKDIEGLVTPHELLADTHVYHQYTLLVTNKFKFSRDQFKDFLQTKGIISSIFYPIPLYKFPHLKKYVKKMNFPVTERLSGQVLSIPTHPLLTQKETDYIISIIKNI